MLIPLLIAALGGCTPSDLPPPPGLGGLDGGATPGDTALGAGPSGDAAPGDSASGGPPADTAPGDTAAAAGEPEPCPPEMRPIPDAEAPAFCIDTWEVQVEGELGDSDQYTEGAEPTLATTISAAGRVPSVSVSFGQAAAACANTPVLDAEGQVVGYKRLATTEEWMDAADGLLGEGGSDYPYGDVFDETRCACESAEGERLYAELQPSGSLPGCVSAFGVYDQSGNAWEWADPQEPMDVSGWFAGAAAAGLQVWDEGGYLAAAEGSIPQITVQGVDPETAVLVEGLVQVTVERSSWDYSTGRNPLGYASYRDDDGEKVYLPIEVEVLDIEAESSQARVRVMSERDGQPVTNKVGGAYYTDPGTCKTAGEPSRDHPHDFDGTISFRCSADPLTGG